MGIVGRFESAMRGLVEGTFGRLIRTSLQRNEFGPQVERAMEDHLRGSPNGREAPTLYDIYLSEKDYEEFGDDAKLAQELSGQLIQMARERNYWLERKPVIRFHEDPHVITGQMRIASYILDDSAAPSGDEVMEQTVSISPAEVQRLNEDIAREQARNQANISLPPAWLTLFRPTRGQPMRLLHSPIHIGRHLSNEIIVNDRRVSRHHAEIRYERGQFVLYDLSSTNGVKINGVATRQPVPLRNNDLITVGSHEFVFQRR
ncbi:MAG TPA: DUF3662 and FHA domain-containing protein [Ktedonobacterales bacterium]